MSQAYLDKRRVVAEPAFQRSLVVGGLILPWLLLRAGSLVWAALVSQFRPLTPLEQSVALWPPSFPLLLWLERAVLAPWQRWDSTYYLSIVERGYRVDDGTAQFHPLLPWLATPLSWITGSPMLALLLVSSAAGLAFVLVFQHLAQIDHDAATARQSTLLLLFWPVSFVLFVPYTEPLFLLWAALCLLWARQQRWWLAGLSAALAVLTRQQGVFLALPLAWELWEASGRSWRRAALAGRQWLSLAFIPAALLVWLVYRAAALNDMQASSGSLHDLLYSIVISPSSSKVVPVQAFLPPWQALGLALGKMWREPELSLGIDLVLAALFLCLVVLAWPRMRASYRLYVVLILLISFAYYTGPIYPYMGLPRHLLLAFPVFLGVMPMSNRPVVRIMTLGSAILGSLFLTMLYVLEAWTP